MKAVRPLRIFAKGRTTYMASKLNDQRLELCTNDDSATANPTVYELGAVSRDLRPVAGSSTVARQLTTHFTPARSGGFHFLSSVMWVVPG
jgi:hypothetical protein